VCVLTAPRDSGALHCPYTQCRKRFEKPIVLTDATKIVRETYYACPHCRCKLDLSVDKASGDVISIDTTSKPVDIAPSCCKHYFGYLKVLDENVQIPDECAVCPKVMQCFVKKSQGTVKV